MAATLRARMFSSSMITDLISTARWVSIVFACVFAADSAADGSVRSVVAIGLAVLVAVWWALRDEVIDRQQDLIASLVLAAAAVIGEPTLAFAPAIIVSVAALTLSSTSPAALPTSKKARLADSRSIAVLGAQIEADERHRAAWLAERTGSWLTYAKIGLDRHLSSHPDPELAELREDLGGAILEIEHRARHMRLRISRNASLETHARTLLLWWEDHYGAETTLEITDPDERLSSTTEQALLTILLEAINNAGQHAQAEHLKVLWEVQGKTGKLTITDDGRGFDPGAQKGAGFAAMQRAAERVGANLAVESNREWGTIVSVWVSDW
jgi:signal transduction histidine kinase